jgi:hypothetical protein
LLVDHSGRWVVADVYLPVHTRLVDTNGHPDAGLGVVI